jgi:hypothetical protein
MGTVLLSVGHGDGSPVQRLGHVLDMAGHGDGSPVHSCPEAWTCAGHGWTWGLDMGTVLLSTPVQGLTVIAPLQLPLTEYPA